MLNQKPFNAVKERNADEIRRYGRLQDSVVGYRDSALEDYELGLPSLSFEEPVPVGCEEDDAGQVSFVLEPPVRCNKCGVEISPVRIQGHCSPCGWAEVWKMCEEQGRDSWWY